MNFVMNLAHRGVSQFSGGASERGIRRSEVRFHMGTRNFFPCPTFVTRRIKHLSLFLYRAQNLSFLLFPSTVITLSTLLILAAVPDACPMRVSNRFFGIQD